MEIKTLDDFKKSFGEGSPPASLSVYGKSLWWAGRGNWEHAHDLIQDLNDQKAYRIHAYLHRVEGDKSNANYWYSKADTNMPNCLLEEEWADLVSEYLK